MNATSLPKKTQSPARQKYVWSKVNARFLWFRLAVPKRYQHIQGSKIVQCCLGTRDKHEASIKAGRLRADLYAKWTGSTGDSSELQAPLPPRKRPELLELKLAATEAAYLGVSRKFQALLSSKNATESFVLSLGEQRKRLLRGRHSDALPIWEDVADRCIRERNWDIPSQSELYAAFVGMISEAGIEALRIEYEQLQGNFGAAPNSPIVLAGLKAKAVVAPAGETVIELFERYASQRLEEKRKRLDTINQDRKVIEQFSGHIGENRCIRSIAPQEIRAWRDVLRQLPPNWQSQASYRGLTPIDAAAKASRDHVTGRSPTTVNKYLSTISPLFDWCRRHGYADHNPCDGLFLDIIKGSNPRPPFTPDQLNSILGSPLFTGFLRDGREHKPGNVRARDWRYWIPLICLFTGARIGEVAQLRVCDVMQDGEIWFLHIRSDEKTGQKTKSGRSRTIPIHSRLRQIGFLAFVERQRSEKSDRLFPELDENARGHVGAIPSRFWRKYLSRIGIKDDGDGFGAHSFRHTMADHLRLAGYLDDEIEVALGHNQKTVTSGYGIVPQGTLNRLSEMLEAVKFDFLETKHL